MVIIYRYVCQKDLVYITYLVCINFYTILQNSLKAIISELWFCLADILIKQFIKNIAL